MKTNLAEQIKSVLIVFLLIAISTNSFAQNNVQTIGYVRTAKFGKEIVYYDQDDAVLNGTYKIAQNSGSYIEATFVDGKPDGKFTAYNDNGKLDYYTTYDNGVGNGKGESYDENGKVLNSYAFKNGEEHGEWTYRSNFGVYRTENYNEGSKEGKWVNTSRNYDGAVTSITTENYKNNEPFGAWNEKTGDGKTVFTANYKDRKNYTKTEFFENGNTKLEMEYKNGVKTMEKKYYDNGKLALVSKFNASGPIGIHQKFNNKGIKTRETSYKNGKIDGVDTLYDYDDGSKKLEQGYKMGIEDGVFKEYHSQGQLYTDGQKVKGQREGIWKYYGSNGKLIRERKFENNIEISNTEYKR